MNVTLALPFAPLDLIIFASAQARLRPPTAAGRNPARAGKGGRDRQQEPSAPSQPAADVTSSSARPAKTRAERPTVAQLSGLTSAAAAAMSLPAASAPAASQNARHAVVSASATSGAASRIPNYGERDRAGEAISTAFTESAVNQVIAKRVVKGQQMRWKPCGAHLLLQVRTRVVNDQLAGDFRRWYPGLSRTPDPMPLAA